MPNPYTHDTSFYPRDKAILPARLEAMRPGQIRDAVSRKAECIVPVAALDSTDPDVPLGFDPWADPAFSAWADQHQAVVAPTLWYVPTHGARASPQDGRFDLPLHPFACYLENVLKTVHELGFATVRTAVFVDLDSPERHAPLVLACRFVQANLFNDLWKDPAFGRNWWDRPDREKLHWQRFAMEVLRRPAVERPVSGVPRPPPRLETLTPRQLRSCVRRGYALLVPSGVIENHGNQNPVGCDGFEAQDPVLLAAAKAPAVVAPTVWFGPTCYGVTGPELGTTDIDGHVYEQYMEGVVDGLAALGFRRVIFVQVHQGSGGAQWAGTAMAIQACQSARHEERNGGTRPGQRSGSGRKPTLFEIISPPHAQYDHAGRNETSWMLHLRPESTDVSLLRPNDYGYCWHEGNEAKRATAEWGRAMCEKTVAGLIEVIGQGDKTGGRSRRRVASRA